MACLTATRLEMGLADRVSAYFRASVNSASGSQTFHTRPITLASVSLTHSEYISSHAALCLPSSSGIRYEEAASGATPRLVNGHFSRASDDINVRSANQRILAPMPTFTPFTAQINVF